MNPTEKLSVAVGASNNYNKTKYSLQSAFKLIIFHRKYKASIDWQLPKTVFLSTEFTYTINSQRAAGFNTKVPIWKCQHQQTNAELQPRRIKIQRC
jgi:hypothetical protein